ncbi:uncharacterized protein PV09_02681 [Verruconis gallopava]|uniref:Uncharacterized protein n=1 Tax=Verruconis gallopava TaxID=253628 RepID=A0A0D2AH08_9PEZI|nr:uncharacterized protein PV09_02681 [Verruconis gallopava]KIW06203.1 hypothetical protein PV09_02681 [Verruconis gallopava]
MSPPPATPPNDHERASLWPSPQFSDYFSDAGDSSTCTAADQRKLYTPVQVRILDRLGAIARKVAEHEQDGGQTPHLSDFDSELSALETKLNAPESQTREIAEETGSLFQDEDDPAVLLAENDDLRRELREGRDVIARITRLRESLQQHYDEMKANYQLAIQRLSAASEALSTLKQENESLKADNEKLREQNIRLHDDLQSAIPTISRLKSRLENVERSLLQPCEPEERDKLEQSIVSLNHEFDDVELDFKDIARRYRKSSSSRVDSAIGNCSSQSPTCDARSVSPETGHRSMIIIRRGGLIRRIDADAYSSYSEELDESDDAEQDDEQDDEQEVEKSSDVQHGSDDFQHPDSSEEREDEKPEPVRKTRKTPWEELWDSIAEFAGMHNYYDDST